MTMPRNEDLFVGFDQREVEAIRARYAADSVAAGKAKATRRHTRHQMRRAKAEVTLAEILPPRFAPDETWHVLSHGDIDALSYLRHALQAVTHFDFVLISSWCIATEDMQEIQAWLDAGRIEDLTLCAGEIFPSQYGDEYELACRMADTYGVRLIIARNHSKVTLASNEEEGDFLVVESSANVNTNPRIEQTTISNSRELFGFYKDFYHGLKTIDKRTSK